MTELTNEQTEKLLQLQDATGMEDLAMCRVVLENHNWNLESAVHEQLHMSEASSQFSDQSSQYGIFPNANSLHRHSLHSGQGMLRWSCSLLYLPFQLILNVTRNLFLFVISLLHPISRHLFLSQVPSNPFGDVQAFKEDYERKYGVSHPNFFIGSYSDALNAAKRELCFLLAYLHCEDHNETDQFCRQMIFWACSVKKAEGYRVSQSLRENGYPFLALIVLKNSRMTAVARMEGYIMADELLNTLTRAMSENETSLIRARLEREERQMNQVLREEQDHAYQESLKADREKQKRKEEERLRKEQEERERQLKEQEAIQLREMLYYYVFCHPESPDRFEIATSFPLRVLSCTPIDSQSDPPTFAAEGFQGSETLWIRDLDA